jgi:DNA polymerase-3 subunit delta
MTAIKAAEIDGFVARPDPAKPIVLVFGPDSGLVQERIDALVNLSVDDPKDPFALARLDSDMLAAEPRRLVEEALTVPLFGGRRAVWVKAGSKSIVEAVELLLGAPLGSDCRVLIEAGDLKRNAPLRTLCEKSKIAVALPCYADGPRELTRLIDSELRDAGLAIAPDAKTLLASLLGGDRRASRNEVQKLALYARGEKIIDLDDVFAVVADATALALDGAIDAAFAGRPSDLERELARASTSGVAPSALISAALRHVIALHKARLMTEDGAGVDEALNRFIPPLHFKRRPLVDAALKTWTATRLEKLMLQFADTVLDVRRNAGLAETLAQRALLAVAVAAKRK